MSEFPPPLDLFTFNNHPGRAGVREVLERSNVHAINWRWLWTGGGGKEKPSEKFELRVDSSATVNDCVVKFTRADEYNAQLEIDGRPQSFQIDVAVFYLKLGDKNYCINTRPIDGQPSVVITELKDATR